MLKNNNNSIKNSGKVIDISSLCINNRKLSSGLILPAIEDTKTEIAVDHAADPIKSLDDIDRISSFLLANGRYRDNMLFIVGINFGLRASDLRMLRFSDIITPNSMFKETFPVFEKKTRNTRKKKKNRYITINAAVMEAVTTYLSNTPGVTLSDYMFKSLSNNSKGENTPISVRSIDRLLKGIANDLGLTLKMSTHTLRKTFCYHQMAMSGNSSRKLLLLQQMLNHSSPAQTLDYIGITFEEIQQAYTNLNLGSGKNYMAGSNIVEEDIVAG